MWKLNDGYEIKAFRNGENLLTPVIQTLVKMKDAMQSGDQKALQPILTENKKTWTVLLIVQQKWEQR